MKEVIPAVLAGERVDRVVALFTELPRSEVAALVAAGLVRVDGRPVTAKSRRVSEGELLTVDVPERSEATLEGDPGVAVPVVYEDAVVVVVDKPAGLVVHPGSGNPTRTLVHGLLARYPDLASIGAGERDRPGIVHRLDVGTSGLLVVARTAGAHESLVAQLQARTMERRYTALVTGAVEGAAGVVDAPLGRADNDPTRMTVRAGGREARTRYEVRRRFADPIECTLVECRLETGRTHQIRVHMAAIGHPVVGDARYGGLARDLPLARPFLHAAHLAFDHPVSGDRVSFTSPLPADLEETRDRLR